MKNKFLLFSVMTSCFFLRWVFVQRIHLIYSFITVYYSAKLDISKGISSDRLPVVYQTFSFFWKWLKDTHTFNQRSNQIGVLTALDINLICGKGQPLTLGGAQDCPCISTLPCWAPSTAPFTLHPPLSRSVHTAGSKIQPWIKCWGDLSPHFSISAELIKQDS